MLYILHDFCCAPETYAVENPEDGANNRINI
jgi:hypothetical protein